MTETMIGYSCRRKSNTRYLLADDWTSAIPMEYPPSGTQSQFPCAASYCPIFRWAFATCNYIDAHPARLHARLSILQASVSYLLSFQLWCIFIEVGWPIKLYTSTNNRSTHLPPLHCIAYNKSKSLYQKSTRRLLVEQVAS